MSKILKFFFDLIDSIRGLFNVVSFKAYFVSIKLIEKKIFLLEKREKSQFYYIKNNAWPFFFSLAISLILLKIVFFLHDQSFFASSIINVFLVLLFVFCGYGWFKNLNNESLYESEQTIPERKNLVQGFLFFILIEFMTFAACFWVLFHSGLAPSIWIGALWPGEGIVSILVTEDVTLYDNYNKIAHFFDNEPCTINYNSNGLVLDNDISSIVDSYPESIRVHINLFDKGQLINPYKVPLMNTFILLLSAATITISHKSLKLEKYFFSVVFLFLTIILGTIFVKIQYLEYINSMVSGHDGIYGNVFFAITGLHGLHVIMGIIFLFVCLINLIFKKYSTNLHRSFEFAIWYWHFVDVIWIFVYFLLYLWPASFFFKEGMFVWTISENYYCVNMSVDAYKDILYLNYLQEIKNKDSNLNWVAENLQNYNTQLIRRDIDHYHFFLEMTREYILIKVRLHRYMEENKYESVFVFFLMFLYTIYSDKILYWVVFFSVIIWFKSDNFDFLPFFQRVYKFCLLFLSTEKSKRSALLLSVWSNIYLNIKNYFIWKSNFLNADYLEKFFFEEVPGSFLDNAIFNNVRPLLRGLIKKIFILLNFVNSNVYFVFKKTEVFILNFFTK